MKITLVMVLKNEGRTVRKAIESVLPIVDEAVIGIDKSTSDNTREEVHAALGTKYSAFFDFEFKNDFSAIRNQFIEKANHEWVLILDGHEYLDQSSLTFLKELKNNPAPKVEIYDFNIFEPTDDTYFQQPRLFRSGIRYELPIHNVISQRENRISFPQAIIVHDQPLDRYKQRRDQRREMNVKGLKEKADKGDLRSMYYLGDAFYELNDYKNAAYWFKKYIPKSDFPHERYEARCRMALINDKQGDLESAEKYAMDCFNDDVNLNEHLIMLGDIHYKQENFYRAIYYYRLATTIKLPDIFLIVNKNCYSWFPWYKLALAYMSTNDIDGLRECINKGKQLAPDREEFYDIEDKLKEKMKMHNLEKKGKLYVVASLPIFIEPYLNALQDKYYLRFDTKFNPENAENADVILCDWLDHNAIAVSHYKGKAKKIIRVHAYEVFNDFFLNRIDFHGIDQLVFVAPHIKDFFNDKIQGWGLYLKQQVISNGVNLDKFQIAENKNFNQKIAWAGFITNKKGANLLLFLASSFPKYEFHVCGTFQEPDVAELFKHRKPDNMFIYPWQEDLNGFFADKMYILNTSPREGCPVSVLQGMACGLEPLIFDWIGSEVITDNRFKNREDLAVLLMNDEIDFGANRKKIEVKFDLKEKINQMINLVDNLIKEKNNAREDGEVTVQANEKS